MAKKYKNSLTIEQANYILDMHIARKFRQWWPNEEEDGQGVIKGQGGFTGYGRK